MIHKYKKIIIKVLKILSKILLGNLVGNIPHSIITNLQEEHRPSIRTHLLRIKSFSKPLIITYNYTSELPNCFEREKTFEELKYYILKDVYYSPQSGLTWTNSKIFLESIGSLNRLLGWENNLNYINKKVKPIKGIIFGIPPNGYYHWLFEILPSLLLFKNSDYEYKLVLSPDSPSYYFQALNIIYEKASEIILISKKNIICEQLIMPKKQVESGIIHPLYIKSLRNSFLTIQRSFNSFNKYIYISRKKSPKRHLENEEELEKRLKLRGVTIIYCEDLDFESQIKIFCNVEIIIAPHGAGLSNIVWTKKCKKVIEIFPFEFYNWCYARLTLALGIQYEYVSCDKSKDTCGLIPIEYILEKI